MKCLVSCFYSYVFVEEDIHGCYSKVVEKYFIAEGVVSKHSVIVGSQDVDPHLIVFLVDRFLGVLCYYCGFLG